MIVIALARPFLFFALSTVMAQSVLAQDIIGTISDVTGKPVSDAAVQLLDASAVVVRKGLSDATGAFRLSAPGASTYKLRVLRIGFRPFTSADFSLRPGEVLRRDLRLTEVPVSLAAVTVTRRPVCRMATDSATSTFGVWSQARAALAALAAGGGSGIVTSVVRYDKRTEAGSHRVVHQSYQTHVDSVSPGWTGVAGDSLHAHGYIVSAEDSATYLAPDLDMLASDLFIRDHCFRLTSTSDSARLGIAFEPTPDRRRIPGIAGTLWLDRASSELREAEFRYVNARQLAGAAEARGALAFARLSGDAWVITRWSLRMPITERRTTSFGSGRTARQETRVVITGFQEVGGQLAMARRGSETLWAHPGVELRGLIVDSTTGVPVRGARVGLMGTTALETTDDSGHFAIVGVLPGEYTVEVRTLSLDSVGAVQRTTATVAAGVAPIRLRAPSAQDVARALCRSSLATADRVTGLVVGVVGATDSVDTLHAVAVGIEPLAGDSGRTASLTTRTDNRGRFRICGAPIGRPFIVQAWRNGEVSAPKEMIIPIGHHFVPVTLQLERLDANAVLSGIVVDSGGRPIAGADVAFPGLRKSLSTDSTGVFRLREIPAGSHRLIVRKIGWGPLDSEISFSAGSNLYRRVVLFRMTVLETVETRADARLRDFDDNRRLGLGHFVTQADIEREKPLVTAQVLSTVPGLKIIRAMGRAYAVTSRGPTTMSGVPCGSSRTADVYVDGVRLYSGRPGQEPFDINSIDPSLIAGIEFYSGPAQTPPQYQNLGTVCGVLVIWTRR